MPSGEGGNHSIYNLMFRWFVGLGIDDPVWVPTVFTKNRDRLLTTEMSRKVMAAILANREVAPLLSDEHFSVDGTLVKAWTSMKSFQPKADAAAPDDDGPGDPPTPDATLEPAPSETDPMPRTTHRHRNAEVDFKGEKRSNATHASITDPDARLYKKSPGTGAMLCFIGHALMENRNGLIVQGDLTQVDGHAERTAALDMVHRHSPGSTRRLTLGADKGYDAGGFVSDLRKACVTPHVAQKARYSAIDGLTTRHEGYALSQKYRKKIEEAFRMGENRRRHGTDYVSRRRARPVAVHHDNGRRITGLGRCQDDEIADVTEALATSAPDMRQMGGRFHLVYSPAKFCVLAARCAFPPDSRLQNAPTRLSPLRDLAAQKGGS